MFAGHFGLAAVVKAKQPATPLWALMLSTQLLDVLFVPLVLLGVESVTGNSGYGEGVIHAYYTHSLVGALLIALCAGLLAWRKWGRESGLVIAAVVFSHWLLDLLVHRPDLPILPGNLGNLPFLGLGLWNFPIISIALEALLVVAGAAFYISSVLSRTKDNTAHQAGRRTQAIIAGTITSALLVLALITSVLGF